MAHKRNQKRGHKATGTPVGHPPFTPTPMERQFVLVCAGARMSYDEICKVIGAGRNEDGKPIAKTTLIRNFKTELANGRAMLRSRVIGKFYQALDNNEPWAIQMGLRNQFGWDNGRSGFQVSLPDDIGGVEEPARLDIRFVLPKPEQLEPPRDVTPHKAITPDVRRDYTAPPEPPVIDARPLPPTSVPIAGKKRGWDWS
jgi:hypothetical protein